MPRSSMPWLTGRCTKVFSQAGFGGIDTLHLADFFDPEAQHDIHHGAVESGAPKAGGHHDYADLAQQTAGKSAERADHALRQGEDVFIGAGGSHSVHPFINTL